MARDDVPSSGMKRVGLDLDKPRPAPPLGNLHPGQTSSEPASRVSRSRTINDQRQVPEIYGNGPAGGRTGRAGVSTGEDLFHGSAARSSRGRHRIRRKADDSRTPCSGQPRGEITLAERAGRRDGRVPGRRTVLMNIRRSTSGLESRPVPVRVHRTAGIDLGRGRRRLGSGKKLVEIGDEDREGNFSRPLHHGQMIVLGELQQPRPLKIQPRTARG